MPLTKSAKKTLKIDRRRKAENDLTRARVKSALKGAKIAIRDGQKDAQEKVSAAYKELDIAAKKNVIHKNKSSRIKSRLSKKMAASGIASEIAVKAAKKPAAKKTATPKTAKKTVAKKSKK